ncbi:hypothetical protein GGR57DRAFT_453479 [Xylariaceae sp. FL1272]|nr:hypothetical protein GGR57DRAFT_453479 [Xylariaceae sp. FL1272]
MKALKMNKVLRTFSKKNNSGPDISADSEGDAPEAIAKRNVKSFCESSRANGAQGGDEVLYLPPIVDAAESSPSAAGECAYLIRRYLKDDYWKYPDYQYNALMLVRILSDNPGETFTRNIDQKFVETTQKLLRDGRDARVRQMLMETLSSFETTKFYDDGLKPLIEMWKSEKEKAQKNAAKSGRGPMKSFRPPPDQQIRQFQPPPVTDAPYAHSRAQTQNYPSRPSHSRRLPDPAELASRLEEARTSANLLSQMSEETLQQTLMQKDLTADMLQQDFLGNDLLKEFADRCQKASKSIQGYMTAENPAPDPETMGSLIDTDEVLQQALTRHHRGTVKAQKEIARLNQETDLVGTHGDMDTNENGYGSSRRESPSLGAGLGISSSSAGASGSAPRRPNGKGKEREYDPPSAAGPSRSDQALADDPFRDPDEPAGSSAAAGSSSHMVDLEPPFHPGFKNSASYMGRQESAVGKEAMHGAVEEDYAPPPGPPRRLADVSDDDSDGYQDPPNKDKQPMYRY